MCWRLGAASIFLAIYIAISFSHLLKIAFLGRARSTQTAVSCVWWSCVSGLHAKGLSVSVSPGLIRMRVTELWGEVIKHNRLKGSLPLLPPAHLAAQLGELLPHEERLLLLFPQEEGKLSYWLISPRRHHGQIGRLQQCWVSPIELELNFHIWLVARFVGRGNGGERPSKTHL